MTFEPIEWPGEDDDQPVPHQQQRDDAYGRLREFADACDTDMEIIAGPPKHDAPYLSLSDLEAVLNGQVVLERIAEDAVAELKRQQPAEATGGEQAQDGAAADVVAFLDAWEADRGFGNTIRGGNGDIPYLFASDLRAVLAERDALAARVAGLESERSRWHDPICGTYYPEAEAVTAREARANAAAETEES